MIWSGHSTSPAIPLQLQAFMLLCRNHFAFILLCRKHFVGFFCFYAGSILYSFSPHICNCCRNCTLNYLIQIILQKMSVKIVTNEHGSNVSNHFWWKQLSIHWKSLWKTCASWCWQNLHCRERIVTSTSIELGSNVRIP